MKKYTVLILGFFVVIFSILLVSCSKEEVLSEDEEENEEVDLTVHDDASDYVWDTSNIINIVLNGTSITVTPNVATVSGSTVTITSAGVYNITGTLTNGQVIVDTEDTNKVVLILNGVNITNSTSAAIFVKEADKVVINLPSGTQNYLTDGTSYVYASATDDEPNATLFSKAYLTIFGDGNLSVVGNYNDGINCKDGLIIQGGTINVTAKDDAIRGKDYLIIKSGTFTLVAGGDGLKSDNENNEAIGYITIEKGTFTITATGDAIGAQTSVNITSGSYTLTSGGGSSKTIASTASAKAIKGSIAVTIADGTFNISSAEDGIHCDKNITIEKGTFTISAADDGMHADAALTINNGDITITKAIEAIEGGQITVNNGNISLTASDDGFNATYGTGSESSDGSCLTINAGYIYVNTTTGDGLDSNGNIVISGGTIVVHGPKSSPEVAMDYNGTCKVTGGFMILSGTNSNMTQAPSTSSTQNSLKLMFTSSIPAGTLFHIEDATGTEVVTFKPERSYYSIVFSSPNLKTGTTYKIYTGGSTTGTNKNGVFEGGTYTPGTLYSSVTLSSVVTSLGSSSGR